MRGLKLPLALEDADILGKDAVSEPRAVATGSTTRLPVKRDYIDFQDRSSPLGYLITFRSYGTWLHGDERGSVDRHHRVYGSPGLPPSSFRRQHDRDLLKQPPVKLGSRQRPIIESAIRETCGIRRWALWALNVRTNHVHAVISANKKPDAVLSALKANATRNMREAGLWTSDLSPWEFREARSTCGPKNNWLTRSLTLNMIKENHSTEAEPGAIHVRTQSDSDRISHSG